VLVVVRSLPGSDRDSGGMAPAAMTADYDRWQA